MKIFGQPESYSDMLQRIFYTSVASGLICTVILSHASPAVKVFLDTVPTVANIGPLKGLKALYVLIPLAIGLISRIVRLHDKISVILRIRFLFDTRYLLFPLAELSGHNLTKNFKKAISKNRVDAMNSVFNIYAGFIDPVIDTQLVRTAADNWGWFHDLRHTYASLLIEQGENLKYIQNQLGHSNPTVTLNVYAHLMNQTNQESACRLENTVLGKDGCKMVAEEGRAH
jgi:hypothetical protein